MKSVFSSRSLRDIDQLLAYISKQSPQIADSISATIDAKIIFYRDNPALGARTSRPGIYRFAIKKYRLTIFYRYRIKQQEIEILRVVRGKRVRQLGMVPL